MKKTFLNHFMLFAFVAILGIMINSCGEDTIISNNPNTPDTSCADTTLTNLHIKGKITFVDTNFVRSGGVYLISAYPRGGWPPLGGPISYDTVRISGNNLEYCYDLGGFPALDTTYVLSVGFRKSTGGQSPVMSVYGCDTSHQTSCWIVSPGTVRISPTSGARYINMISWSDTAKKVY